MYKYILNIIFLLISFQSLYSLDVDVSQTNTRFFSVGLFSSADSIKTSVNLEFGFKLFKTSHFEIKSYTSLVGSKIYDDNPHLYQLGFMQKLTFGGVDEYIGTISVTRYGFAFGSFGFLSFDSNKNPKSLLEPAYYAEVGGGAGFNINVSRNVAILLEFGGGLHMVVGNGADLYPDKILKAGFGRMSIGSRYYFNFD